MRKVILTIACAAAMLQSAPAVAKLQYDNFRASGFAFTCGIEYTEVHERCEGGYWKDEAGRIHQTHVYLQGDYWYLEGYDHNIAKAIKRHDLFWVFWWASYKLQK